MDERDRDTLMRLAAFDHVRRLSEVCDILTATDLKPGFVSLRTTPTSASGASTRGLVMLCNGENMIGGSMGVPPRPSRLFKLPKFAFNLLI